MPMVQTSRRLRDRGRPEEKQRDSTPHGPEGTRPPRILPRQRRQWNCAPRLAPAAMSTGANHPARSSGWQSRSLRLNLLAHPAIGTVETRDQWSRQRGGEWLSRNDWAGKPRAAPSFSHETNSLASRAQRSSTSRCTVLPRIPPNPQPSRWRLMQRHPRPAHAAPSAHVCALSRSMSAPKQTGVSLVRGREPVSARRAAGARPGKEMHHTGFSSQPSASTWGTRCSPFCFLRRP